MLQQKHGDAQIFCNPVNAKMEQWTTSYIKLTMPKKIYEKIKKLDEQNNTI